MSTTYAGNDNWPTPVTIADDGDAAAMTIVSATEESTLDRTQWLRKRLTRPFILPLGSMPYVQLANRFATDYNHMSVTTATAVGDTAKWTLSRLVHGLSVSAVEVLFVPKTTHAGLPATPPAVQFMRWRVESGVAPPVVESLASTTYSPVSFADYTDGEVKVISCLAGHTVDNENYIYQVAIVDESGANAVVGNTYFAVRVTYA